MWRVIASLVLSALAGVGSATASKGQQTGVVRHASGMLEFNFEYGYFAEKGNAPNRVFEYEVEDTRWRDEHREMLMADPRSLSEYRCISGLGYEDRGKTGSTGRTTFVFTKILAMKKARSEDDCIAFLRRR